MVCLENVLKIYFQEVLNMAKTNMLVLTKTSWRRLEDVFWRRKAKANIFVLIKTSSSRRMFAGKLIFSSEKSRNVDTSIFKLNLEVPTSCSEKSENISCSLEIPHQCILKYISVNNLVEPSNIISTGKYHNCNISYSQKF